MGGGRFAHAGAEANHDGKQRDDDELFSSSSVDERRHERENKNFRNDDDIDDFDDCFSIGVRMQRWEQENASGKATQSVTSIPSEIDASRGGIPMIDSNGEKIVTRG